MYFISICSKLISLFDSRTSTWNRNSFSAAEAELRGYKAQHGVTPEYLEALSWMARGAASMRQWDQASAYASETRTLCEQQLAKRKLDADGHLPIALGAAYEVLAQSMAEKGHQAEAVHLLRIGPGSLRGNLDCATVAEESQPAGSRWARRLRHYRVPTTWDRSLLVWHR